MENIKEVQSTEWYNMYAKQFVWKHWGMKLSIPVKLYNRKSNRNGFFEYKRMTVDKMKNRIPLFIKLNTSERTHEDIIDTLKHELCHWYTFVTGKDFSDGDKDFEETLLSVGATSTDGRNDKTSKFYQQAIVSGKANKKGFTDVKYVTLEDVPPAFYSLVAGTRFDCLTYINRLSTGSEVYYQGEYIGTVFQLTKGSWVGISKQGTLVPGEEYFAYYSRKSVVESFLYEHLEI